MAQLSLSRRTTYGVIWLGFQSASARAASLLAQLILARLLVPSDFGVIALASTVTTIVATLVGFGIDDVLLQRNKQIFLWEATAFWLSLFFGLFGFCLVLCITPFAADYFDSKILLNMLPISALSMLVSSLYIVPLVRLKSKLSFRVLGLYGSIEAVLLQCLIVICAYFDFGALSFVIPLPFTALLKLGFLSYNGGFPKASLSLRLLKKQSLILLGRSAYLFGSKVSGSIVSQADVLILGALSNPQTVGSYYFAYRLAVQPLRMLAGNINGVLFPALSTLRGEIDKQRRVALNACEIISFLVIPMGFLQASLTSSFFSLVFPKEWASSVLIMEVLSVSLPLDAVTWIAGSFLNATGQFNKIFWLSILGGVLFCILVLFGGVFGSAFGVSCAVGVYYAFYGPLFLTLTFGKNRLTYLNIFQCFIIAPAFSIAANAVPVYLEFALHQSLAPTTQILFRTTFFLVIYVTLLYSFKKSLLKSFLRKFMIHL